MKQSIKLFAALAAAVSLMASCSITSKIEKNAQQVSYTELQNYFVNNTYTVSKTMRKVIKSEEEFYQIFGQAATMGTNGAPTAVNFKTQYVLAVLLPETSKLTQAYPVSVLQNGNALIFNYKVEKGAQQSYSMLPFTAVVLDRPVTDQQMEIYFNEK